MDTQSSARLKPARILVVDDREENIVAMQAVLAGCGYELLEAHSGHKAIEIAKQGGEFAVILLDVQMPTMDGFQCARRLRELPGTKTTPIVFVSAIHRTEEYEEMGYLSGAVDFLFKPFNPTVLQAKVAVFAEMQRQAHLLKEAALKEQELVLLRETLAMRDEFLSIVSHELKTPITPLNLQVQSFIQMLRDDKLKEAKPERLQRMLTTSQKQIERLTRLVDELTDLSRLKADHLELRRQSADIKALVERVIEQFTDDFAKQGCAVTFAHEGEARGYVDTFRIEQIVINLLVNAVKYGAGQPVEVRMRTLSGRVFVDITDHGIGIREEDQKRIFERFERACSNKNYGGLGLGLYIAGRLAELHGGRITVASRVGEGSTFTLQLPLQSEPVLHA